MFYYNKEVERRGERAIVNNATSGCVAAATVSRHVVIFST